MDMTLQETLEMSRELWKLDPQLISLEKTLLKLGGKKVVPIPELKAEMLLNNGELINYRKSTLARHYCLAPSRCHENSCFLWLDRRDRGFKIVTGWALSDGGWRQHSWGLQRGVLRETTCHRDKYFGVILDYKESLDFCDNNLSVNAYPNSPYFKYRAHLDGLIEKENLSKGKNIQ